MAYTPHPTALRRALVEDVLPLLALAALAAFVLYLVSGCTAATFDTTEGLDDGNAHDASSEAGDHVLNRAAGHGLDLVTETMPPDGGATILDTMDGGVADTRPSVDSGVDGAEVKPTCARYCLISGATGANLPLGSPACLFDGECCSGSCFVSHPGTGERGVCTAPSGDPTTPHWCGAPTEWCADAAGAGIARCVP